MASRMLRSAVTGIALRRSASLRLPARAPLSPPSAVSFSSNTAGGRFEKHPIDENNDESLAARRRHKQERKVSRSRAGDYGDSFWVMDGLWDYVRASRGSSTRQDSTTNSSSSSSSSSSTSALREPDVSSPSSEDLKGSSWSWGLGDSSYSGGGDSFGGGDFFGD